MEDVDGRRRASVASAAAAGCPARGGCSEGALRKRVLLCRVPIPSQPIVSFAREAGRHWFLVLARFFSLFSDFFVSIWFSIVLFGGGGGEGFYPVFLAAIWLHVPLQRGHDACRCDLTGFIVILDKVGL